MVERLKIETIGLHSVPPEQKQTHWLEYAIIQMAFSVNAGNFLVPALAVLEGGLPFHWAILSILLGTALAFVFVSIMSLPGARHGLPAQYLVRTMIGTKFARYFASPIRSLTSLYWFSVQTIGGTYVILMLMERTFSIRLPFYMVSVSLAVIMALLALIGFDAVKRATKWFMPFLLIGQIMMLALFIQEGSSQSLVGDNGSFQVASFLFFASLGFVQYVSGVSASSDITRYSRSPKHGAFGLFVGNFVGLTMTSVLAAFSATLYQSNNPFISASQLTNSSIPLFFISMCALVSMISINLSNAYTGGYSLLNAIPSLGRIGSASVFGILGITLSLFPIIVEEAKWFISGLGAFIIPISAIIISDYVWKKQLHLSEKDLEILANGHYHWNKDALVTVLVATPLYFLLPESTSPGFAVFLFSGAMYIILSLKSKSQSGYHEEIVKRTVS
ncbi:purine-cytosine permease family protein [Bacillus coahuilensis]|uniref:purine-cytosine permease family protein n=1 Tax=Bacillus coahuilensis TaxID=408580 RepID=UPI0001851100|nr:cytosine permease [Bacillus coahuilensis]